MQISDRLGESSDSFFSSDGENSFAVLLPGIPYVMIFRNRKNCCHEDIWNQRPSHQVNHRNSVNREDSL